MGWIATTLTTAAACAALPSLGHAAGSPTRVDLHALHARRSGLWLRTLGTMVLSDQ